MPSSLIIGAASSEDVTAGDCGPDAGWRGAASRSAADLDWAAAAQRLLMFLEQYWGGPHTYSELRGHPRLRMRHAGFRIDESVRDVWLTHMRAALDDVELPTAADQVMWTYLSNAATALVNSP
jgi:hemoglobin